MNIKKIDIDKAKFILLICIYRIVLDIVYIKYIHPIYEYMDLSLNIKIYKIAISYFLMILLSIVINKENKKVSSLILQFHFIVMIIPILSYYSLSDQTTEFVVACVICFIFEIYFIKIFPNIKLFVIKNTKVVFKFILPLVLIAVIVVMFNKYGISFSAIDFSIIYEIRAEQNINGLIGYLWTWNYRIICPVLIIRSLFKKEKLHLIFFVVLQIMMYFITPRKEIILSLILIFGGLYFLKRFNFFKSFLIGLSAIIIIFVLVYQISGMITPLSLIPFRFLTIPAQIKFQHYEFFTLFDKIYFSEGLIGKIFGISYPYGNLSTGNIIALYFSGSLSNSNTGYLAYAYDNFGYIGMFLMSLLVAMVLKLFDSLALKMDTKLVFILSVYPFSTLNDGDILTALLTGGIGILFILLLMLDIDKSEINNSLYKNNIYSCN